MNSDARELSCTDEVDRIGGTIEWIVVFWNVNLIFSLDHLVMINAWASAEQIQPFTKEYYQGIQLKIRTLNYSDFNSINCRGKFYVLIHTLYGGCNYSIDGKLVETCVLWWKCLL
jgi:hypothetical protein